MAITSIGYAGTVSDAEWARLIPWAGGTDYTVQSSDDFRANAAAGDRNVEISTGVAAGQGILDESDAAVVINLPSVGSGSRWDLIGLERDWGTSTSSLIRVAGSSAKALPTRDNDPGVVDVQPLWLLRVAAGQTAIQEFVDLRCFVGNGGAWAADDLVRSYLERVGTRLTIDKATWERRLVLGNPTWVRSSGGVGAFVPPASTRIAEIELSNQVNLTSSSHVQILRLPVALSEAALVDIRATYQWYGDGNTAGTDCLRLGSVGGTIVDEYRWHNNGGGSNEVQTSHLFARLALPVGTTNIYLTGQRESSGLTRRVFSATLQAWATS